MADRYQKIMDDAMSCIHLARAINDRYDDPTKIPAAEAEQRKSLLAEAGRLQELAQSQKAQDDLEKWASAPDADQSVLVNSASKAQRDAVLAGGEQYAATNKAHSEKMFAKALRTPKEHLGNALTLEEKAAIIEDSTGQIIVPHDLAGPIFLTLPRLGVLRRLALTRPTTSNLVDIRLITGATAAWGKIELGTNATQYDAAMAASGPTTVTVQNLNALVQIGVDELADTDANLVSLVQELIGAQFAQAEDDAFANGDGTSKPFGIARRATVGGAIPAAQGVTAASSAVSPDQLKSMPFLITARFANNGVYMASDDATQAIALLKDSTSNYLWQPSNIAGQPGTLFGYPFYRVSGLPSMTATTFFTEPSVIFGDVNSGYLVADRQQITVQRLDERYADVGLVGFLFRQRVGGDVMRPGAFAKYLL
jgi:HK97 family phage major capsid protein